MSDRVTGRAAPEPTLTTGRVVSGSPGARRTSSPETSHRSMRFEPSLYAPLLPPQKSRAYATFAPGGTVSRPVLEVPVAVPSPAASTGRATKSLLFFVPPPRWTSAHSAASAGGAWGQPITVLPSVTKSP